MNDINHIELIKKFSYMETSEELFKIKDGNYFFWDIVRIDILVYLFNKTQDKRNIRPWPIHKKTNIFIRILKNLRNESINFLIRLCLKNKNSKFIFFKTLRIKNTYKTTYDPILDDPFNALDSSKTSFDLLSQATYFNSLKAIFNKTAVLPMPRTIFGIKYPEINEVIKKILTAVKKHFEINIENCEEIILDSIIKYVSDLNFWESVFKNYRPESIILCDNGSFKGLYAAAKKFNIKVYEFQHGDIGKNNLRYFYPKSIEANLQCNLPYSLLTFSKYWNNDISYPIKQIISVGNNNFTLQREAFEKDNENLMIISTAIYQNTLINFVKDLSKKIRDKNIKIFYKLHPGEFKDRIALEASFSDFKNVQIVEDELSLKELINSCQHIIGIHSTLINICLNAGCNIYLYKKGFYSAHEDIMEFVETFDDLDSFMKIYDEKSKNKTIKMPIFFEKFNKQKFLRIING